MTGVVACRPGTAGHAVVARRFDLEAAAGFDAYWSHLRQACLTGDPEDLKDLFPFAQVPKVRVAALRV